MKSIIGLTAAAFAITSADPSTPQAQRQDQPKRRRRR
ncbi:hypothetical protein F441_14681 [Phytophthora nicotianae CJ01A1]|uniref:Uncharacterized protein n=1 Tax=Phytophthora nicotianae CJ01A1 TaxID=1317063 RepID=W2WIN0_PHYNI|nr:hypothetical protein F441_14681 [Phytophthora nicotianae CJ01A1]